MEKYTRSFMTNSIKKCLTPTQLVPQHIHNAATHIYKSFFYLVLFSTIAAHAQLAVMISPVKIVGQKAVVTLAMKNSLAEKVESARAICFLLDDQGKMVGQSTKWVIGGTKDRPALEPKEKTTFNFVITSSQPFTTTNLTAKVSFSRVILENGQVADMNKTVSVLPTP
jgi:hypothetical protein